MKRAADGVLPLGLGKLDGMQVGVGCVQGYEVAPELIDIADPSSLGPACCDYVAHGSIAPTVGLKEVSHV